MSDNPLQNVETKQTDSPVKLDSSGEFKYAILQETSGEEFESWLYFIRYQGNEEALNHLQSQLKQVEWYILDDLSTFDLELDYLVSEKTAKEMTKVDLNHYSFHRKFDGKLQTINLGFKPNYNNEKKMNKAFNVLGYGRIEDYIDHEDIDPEDLAERQESDEERCSSESETDSSSESEESDTTKKNGDMPKIVLQKPKIDIPRYAKAKRRHK